MNINFEAIEIKEILENLKEHTWLEYKEMDMLLDYITNLQQDLDKANDIIKKDRQFYKCRMDEYVKLKKENEELNRMCELYSKSLYNAELTDYKSRCEKANKWVDKHTKIFTKNGISIIDWDNLSDPRKLKNILNGSDENE